MDELKGQPTSPDGRGELHTATLRRRLGRLLVTGGAVLLVVLLSSIFALVRVIAAQTAVTGPYFEAITQADSAYVALLDAEVSLRVFLTTGEQGALEAYHRAIDDEGGVTLHDAETVDALRLRSELALALDRANVSTRTWVADYAEPAIEHTAEMGGDSITATEQARGADLFRTARADTASYIAGLRDSRLERVGELERWTAVLFSSVVVLVAAAIAMGAVLWVVLRRWVTDPVTELAYRVRLVSSGQLDEPITTTAPGEIADLAIDVDHMRRELVSQVAEIKASHEEIEHSHDLLADQAQELERSNRDLEQFAYVASHDLQEPLRKVASFTQLLQKRYGGQLDERADQYIEFAVDGAKRMQRLIQDLLGFSRVGRAGTEQVPVNLERSLAVVLSDLDERIATTGATVTHDTLPVVRGERALLEQLFLNVIGNALKFRDPGRAPVVHIGVREHERHWELSCADNGIGIDEKYAERVFVIFQRLHAKDVYEGTGIGLALCKRIVEYHGGRIWIEPTEGGGTTIRWTLARG